MPTDELRARLSRVESTAAGTRADVAELRHDVRRLQDGQTEILGILRVQASAGERRDSQLSRLGAASIGGGSVVAAIVAFVRWYWGG